MGKATDDLRHEHEVILSVLDIADDIINSAKVDEVKLKYCNEVLYFLSTFTDKCHHGKEDAYLFPTLVLKGVPDNDGVIAILMHEHVLGRAMVQNMREDIDKQDLNTLKEHFREYSIFIRKHLSKENNILFPLSDKLLKQEDQDELIEDYEIHEESIVGHGIHDQIVKMIDKWLIEFEINA
jgi:hemerythrin-like domain-containing protein